MYIHRLLACAHNMVMETDYTYNIMLMTPRLHNYLLHAVSESVKVEVSVAQCIHCSGVNILKSDKTTDDLEHSWLNHCLMSRLQLLPARNYGFCTCV